MITEPETTAKVTTLRVRVTRHDDAARPVDVTIPVAIARWGINMARRFAPELKDLDVDWDDLDQLIREGGSGQLVHVVDQAKGETVDVWLE